MEKGKQHSNAHLRCKIPRRQAAGLPQERPYQHDSTASRLLSGVKHVQARLVLRWGTTLESRVLFFWLSHKSYI